MIARLNELSAVIVSTFALLRAKLDGKVDIGGMIDDSSKLNGQPAEYYAKTDDFVSFANGFEATVRDSSDLFYGISKQVYELTTVQYSATRVGFKLAGGFGTCTPVGGDQQFTVLEIFWTPLSEGGQLGFVVSGDKSAVAWQSFNFAGLYFVEGPSAAVTDGTTTTVLFDYVSNGNDVPPVGSGTVEIRYIPE
jgi:hypothetical protein